MAELSMTSPGYARSAISGEYSLEELPWCGKLNLRGNPGLKKFVTAVESVTGLSLPTEPHTSNHYNDRSIFWLGPDEWLVHCPLKDKDTIKADLVKKLGATHSAVVDVSDYFTVLRLGGSGSDQLLARGCPLDLHPDAFPAGSHMQTRLGTATVLLHKTSDTPDFDVQVRWSYTEYVWDYLVSAMESV